MKFWDASAIVPLLVAEGSTRRLQALAAKDSAMLVWWGSAVECISALARLERDGALSARAMTLALQRLRAAFGRLARGRPKRRNPGSGGAISPGACAACRAMRCNWPPRSRPRSDGQHRWK